MSGFDPAWLALREPADREARNERVLQACQKAFEEKSSLRCCDVGAGTGASVRAFADFLPAKQNWTLVDKDQAVMDAGRDSLATWAEVVAETDRGLTLRHGEKRLDVAFLCKDLAVDPAFWPAETALVTASAFFDLVSADWIGRFVGALASAGAALLATLTVNGTLLVDPPHPRDGDIGAAFRAHQETDKGFGPAAGPWAAGVLTHHLSAAGYSVTTGESPWLLGASQAPLRDAVVEGIAIAVKETGRLPPEKVDAWCKAITRGGRSLRIGHLDVLALPPKR